MEKSESGGIVFERPPISQWCAGCDKRLKPRALRSRFGDGVRCTRCTRASFLAKYRAPR
jgi:hypothetical protein